MQVVRETVGEEDKIRRHVQVKAQTLEKQVVLSDYW